MGRSIFNFLAIFLLMQGAIGMRSASAQLNEAASQLGIELSPHFQYDYTSGSYYASMMYSRIASSSQIDPDAKGTGLVRTVFGSLGTRTDDLKTFDFRWRAGLIDMDFVRTPISMGLTLVDYNKISLLELDVRWVNLRVGPSIYIGNPSNHFSLRAIGTGGVTTMKIGKFAYSGLEADDELQARKRSYEIGYLGEAKLFVASRFSLSGAFQFRHLLGGLSPKRYTVTGKFGVQVSPFVAIQAIYSLEEMRLSRTSLDRQMFGGELSMVF